MVTRTGAPTRREQILREAARLFAERGFHGVGVDEIGAAVGISGPGLYRHFAGKDAMLAELLVGISGQLLEGGRRRVAAAGGTGVGSTGGTGTDSTGGTGTDSPDRTGTDSPAEPAAATDDSPAATTDGDPTTGPEAALDSLIEGHIDFALDDRPLIVLHDRELGQLRESDQKLVRQLQRQYVELWVGVVREVYPELPEPGARAAVHVVFGLLNSTPHLSRPRALPSRTATARLLHRMARGAFEAAAR